MARIRNQIVSMIMGKVILPVLIHYKNVRTYKRNGKEVHVGQVISPELMRKDSSLRGALIPLTIPVQSYGESRQGIFPGQSYSSDLRRGRTYMRGGCRR